MKKISVLISGRGSNMLALHDAICQKEIPAKISRVIADRENTPGIALAQKEGLPCSVVARKAFASRDEFEEALTQTLAEAQPDLIVLAGFMRLLSREFAESHPNMINIHPALLPKYRGLNTHARVLESGDRVHGATVHYVIPELDAGPILLQKRIRVPEDDDAESLAARLLPFEHRCLVLAVRLICEDQVQYFPGEGRIKLNGKPLDARGIVYGPDEEITWQ